jgi:ribosomal protein L37AE/L43A
MKEQLPSNPLSDADTLAEIRARDSRYQLERWSNWVAHDRRWLLAYIERLQCSIDEPKTDDYKCPFCDRPRDAEGSIWHAPDCEGLQNAGITKLQLHMLTTRAAVPPKVNASCEQQARDLLSPKALRRKANWRRAIPEACEIC